MRGLNPFGCGRQEVNNWLNKWTNISSHINGKFDLMIIMISINYSKIDYKTDKSISMLLHCPILLAYNEPTNWKLIYKKKI